MPGRFYTRHPTCLVGFTPGTQHAWQVLHQAPNMPGRFYISTQHAWQVLHQAPNMPGRFYFRHPTCLAGFTPGTQHAWQVLHQAPYMPGRFYIGHPTCLAGFTPGTQHAWQVLHQAPNMPGRQIFKEMLCKCEYNSVWFKNFCLVARSGYDSIKSGSPSTSCSSQYWIFQTNFK